MLSRAGVDTETFKLASLLGHMNNSELGKLRGNTCTAMERCPVTMQQLDKHTMYNINFLIAFLESYQVDEHGPLMITIFSFPTQVFANRITSENGKCL